MQSLPDFNFLVHADNHSPARCAWMQKSPRGYRRLHIAAATDFEDEESLDILLA
ncbi:hypothetical protein [Ensifer sp. SL37]|uniref:hypothetical protein n=1 Tax=Ensifer sp. SL37 TaxID=2995137 RepID=UPI002274CA5B|nr:hypothetical protein [Ensifer sp. SL37]MCY1742783.1 hypothetical protein [Ensifer sp. SL37]